MTARFEIHISDVRSFKTCRRKWNWASPLRRNLEPFVPYAPFFTGRAIHYCIEQYYRSHTPMNDSLDAWLKAEVREMEKNGQLWPQEKVSLDEQIALIRGMLNHYKLWVEKDVSRLRDENFEFISLEKEFSVPLYNPRTGHKSSKVYLAGRFDGLVRYKPDDTFWVWENKTTRSITELERSLANDEQCGAYIYAAEETFRVHVSGVVYNVMRKKVPTQPEVLQNGLLSKRANIDSTAEAYLDAVKRNHPDWRIDTIREFYGDILQTLLDKGNTFFARFAVYRTPAEINQLHNDLWATALEMTRESTPLYPTPSWMNCNFCHFRAACLAQNAGADYEFILREEFRPRLKITYEELPEEGNAGSGV